MEFEINAGRIGSCRDAQTPCSLASTHHHSSSRKSICQYHLPILSPPPNPLSQISV